jgi:dephospho-CoA kinase
MINPRKRWIDTLKIVIITGMPGSGKSEVAQVYRDAGIPVIVMGDIIREETCKRGLDPNPENTKKIMLELRETDGPGAVAKHCLGLFRSLKTDVVVIEGCRSIAEIDVFDDYADEVLIVCVHSSPRVRFARIRERNREDAPPTWEVFRERDLREISVGLGGVIALSDIMLINEGTLENLRLESKKLATKMV